MIACSNSPSKTLPEPQYAVGSKMILHTWTSKGAQDNGPISQNREYRQYGFIILAILEVQVEPCQ